MNPAAAAAADGDDVVYEFPMLIRAFRSGRVERLFPANFIPASPDLTTGVSSKDSVISASTGLSARLYLPSSANSGKKLPVLVYYHGGCFCLMSAFCAEYHTFLNSLAAKANVIVVSVDYRLAPENPLPAAYEDSWEALRWVAAGSDPWLHEFGNPERIFLAGDSAGGNIAHSMGMRLGSEAGGMKAEGLVLLHPFFWGKERIGAEGEEGGGAFFRSEDVEGLWRLACTGRLGLDDPRLNPCAGGAPELRALGCRRALVCVAGRDLLRDRGRAYCEELRGRSGWGGKAELAEDEGEDHVFFLFKPGSEKATAFMERLVFFFREK